MFYWSTEKKKAEHKHLSGTPHSKQMLIFNIGQIV